MENKECNCDCDFGCSCDFEATSLDKAYETAKEKLSEKVFTPQDIIRKTKTRTTIYLPDKLHRTAKVFCAENKISLTQLIIRFLEDIV